MKTMKPTEEQQPEQQMVADILPPFMGELDLCDNDIRQIYENMNGSYFIGTPLIAQLIREIRLLRLAICTIKKNEHGK